MLSLSRISCVSNLSKFGRLVSVVLRNRQCRNYSEKCNESKKESKCGSSIKFPCGEGPTELAKPKETAKQPKLISMWNLENCEPDLCVMDLRYDMKYYRITDKSKRKYQVTWNECPRLLIKPKKVCLYEKTRRPKLVRRKRGANTGSAKAPKASKMPEKGKCFYIKAPCCKVGRRPPKCKSAFPSLGNCEKRKTPFPSFSECKKDPLPDLLPTECRCLDTPALCDAWATLRRRFGRGKSPVKKCGEA